jgi:hypothetical protein
LPTYFGKNGFKLILKFYKAAEEYEALFGGFFKDVNVWKKDKRKLSQENIDYLFRKMDRIIALGKILTKIEIKRFNDLSDDYQGKIQPRA